jgi:DNA-directed RNA polymerase specialized sigma24 family protein
MAHPGGRPRKKFDLKKVELHGRLGSSFEDMAAMFDCSLATIWLHMNDANSEFAKAYKKGAARTSGLKKGKTD